MAPQPPVSAPFSFGSFFSQIFGDADFGPRWGGIVGTAATGGLGMIVGGAIGGPVGSIVGTLLGGGVGLLLGDTFNSLLGNILQYFGIEGQYRPIPLPGGLPAASPDAVGQPSPPIAQMQGAAIPNPIPVPNPPDFEGLLAQMTNPIDRLIAERNRLENMNYNSPEWRGASATLRRDELTANQLISNGHTAWETAASQWNTEQVATSTTALTQARAALGFGAAAIAIPQAPLHQFQLPRLNDQRFQSLQDFGLGAYTSEGTTHGPANTRGTQEQWRAMDVMGQLSFIQTQLDREYFGMLPTGDAVAGVSRINYQNLSPPAPGIATRVALTSARSIGSATQASADVIDGFTQAATFFTPDLIANPIRGLVGDQTAVIRQGGENITAATQTMHEGCEELKRLLAGNATSIGQNIPRIKQLTASYREWLNTSENAPADRAARQACIAECNNVMRLCELQQMRNLCSQARTQVYSELSQFQTVIQTQFQPYRQQVTTLIADIQQHNTAITSLRQSQMSIVGRGIAGENAGTRYITVRDTAAGADGREYTFIARASTQQPGANGTTTFSNWQITHSWEGGFRANNIAPAHQLATPVNITAGQNFFIDEEILRVGNLGSALRNNLLPLRTQPRATAQQANMNPALTSFNASLRQEQPGLHIVGSSSTPAAGGAENVVITIEDRRNLAAGATAPRVTIRGTLVTQTVGGEQVRMLHVTEARLPGTEEFRPVNVTLNPNERSEVGSFLGLLLPPQAAALQSQNQGIAAEVFASLNLSRLPMADVAGGSLTSPTTPARAQERPNPLIQPAGNNDLA